MLNKKIVFISIAVLSLPACQLNAGQNNFPTNIDCRCKDRGLNSSNQESRASVLAVTVLGVNVPPTGNTPTPTGSSTPEPSVTPTTNPSPSSSPMKPPQSRALRYLRRF